MPSATVPPPPPLGPDEVFRLMVLHTVGLERARRHRLEAECRRREARLAFWRLLLDLDAAVGALRDWRCLRPPVTDEEARLLHRGRDDIADRAMAARRADGATGRSGAGRAPAPPGRPG